MTSERIKEIQLETAYPNSTSVQQALLKVWNEVAQDHSKSDFEPLVIRLPKSTQCFWNVGIYYFNFWMFLANVVLWLFVPNYYLSLFFVVFVIAQRYVIKAALKVDVFKWKPKYV